MMDKETRMLLEIIEHGKKECQLTAFILLLEKSETQVDWSYEVWDTLLSGLKSSDLYEKTGASQLLCYLSISDPECRILHSFQDIWKCTYVPNQDLAENALRATWRMGLAGPEQRSILLQAYEKRFMVLCGSEDKVDQSICWTILENLELLNKQLPDRSTSTLVNQLSNLIVANKSITGTNKLI
ncbi:nucleoporin NDC1 [Marinilactibacillus sp. Marseille-P9653]|uniref:nucleoporin NDC1 n=1 Tax=Marinilactibacillus sp. Marseille-P9653 TaxID=2866583 RepID=UPI001CE40779|nr:nucleoporin NDC1 [Marinilactibacillus sp. Marseille-P9653]